MLYELDVSFAILLLHVDKRNLKRRKAELVDISFVSVSGTHRIRESDNDGGW